MSSAPRIAFLLGKTPKPTSLFPELFEHLIGAGLNITVHLPHDERVRLEQLTGSDLIVHRGLKTKSLTLVQALEDAGVPVCNPLAAISLARSRPELTAQLRKAHLPVPLTATAATWAEAKMTATTLSVIKTAGETSGRGKTVIAGTAADLPETPPFAGPYLVQPFVPNEGFDHKIYAAGKALRGLLKPSPLQHGHVTKGAPLELDDTLLRLALRVGEVTGLELYGVDMLLGGVGPVIVDVNPFPGFRGIPEAPRLIAEYLIDRVAASTTREQC